MNWKKLGWGLLAGMLCSFAMAAEPWAPTDAELASLPPLCKVKMKAGAGSPEYITWQKSMGKDWLHTHHYCAGINFINRYYRARSESAKRFNLKNAKGGLEYMVTHAAPTYSLMPDVYLNLGVAYSLSNQPAQAITHFSKAIELNPRQPRAYSAMADYYVKIKQTARALETVSEGLRHNPDTRSLQRRYTELGGKRPYPAPIEPEQAAAPATPPTEKAAAPVVQAPVEQAATMPAPEPVSSPPVIGSPKNPYCRFCPD
jgi:tetratricopeptide (TPR) repeat protein